MNARASAISMPRNGHVAASESERRRVRTITVPAAARQLATLADVHYQDAFLISIAWPTSRTATAWARAILEDSPASLRLQLWSAWSLLGLRLAPPWSTDDVLGWHIRRENRDFVLLGADSLVGMPAELLLIRGQNCLLFDTFVQVRNPLARAVWSATEPVHRRVLPSLLEDFARRAER